MHNIDMKECSHCKESKPLDDFYKAKGGVGGRRGDCKTCVRSSSQAYYHKHTEQTKVASSKYYKIHGDRLRRYQVEYSRDRYEKDSAYRLACNLRNRLRQALKGACKAETTKDLLGCTYEAARAHIEAQFTEGMSWDKMGLRGIHIDHIKPCDSFDLTDPEQRRECFHYTNLQPLWAEDNLRKSNKVTQQ